jgi:DNA gyrase subunit A
MPIPRPDLSNLPVEVLAYIEELEARLASPEFGLARVNAAPVESPVEPAEPPTTICVNTISRQGMIKRTPRHLYPRQHRGGMGIFDLELPSDDPPAFLAIADENQQLLLLTDQARAYHLAVSRIEAAPVRARGQSMLERLSPLQADERLVAVLPNPAQGYIALVSQEGYVRRLRHHVFGDHLRPGTSLFDPRQFGRLSAACHTSGEGDLFIATRQGAAIRFAEKTVPAQGCKGLRLQDGDAICAVCAVEEESGVFLLSAAGQGTIRLMSGFAANKAPGAGGKTAMKVDDLISAIPVSAEDDLFLITQTAKIIRFRADEVPQKEGIVQGVNCMLLRNDHCTALASSRVKR